jgi:hypothetical protein
MTTFMRCQMIDPVDHLRLILDDVGRHPRPCDFAGRWHELVWRRAKNYVFVGDFLNPLDDVTDRRKEIEISSHRSDLRKV